MSKVSVIIGETSSLEKNRVISTSAGCYLLNKKNDTYELLILHKKWPDGKERYVLPKGHREGDEFLEETARRETIEESGYTDFKLLKYIGSCTYEEGKSEIRIKTDHYYLALLESEERRERKAEKYEKDVTVKNMWVDIEEGFKLLTFENQEEIHEEIRKFLRLRIRKNLN
jgi:8-oxo-dGTP pyrophosphatase MutT (NUDIX family)